MAWTAPAFWSTGEMVTAALLNTHIRDNLDALSTHAHTGAAGDGNDELSGIDHITIEAWAFSFEAGRLQRRNTNLYWGAAAYRITNEDPAVGTAGLRTLGSGAQQAATGDHSH